MQERPQFNGSLEYSPRITHTGNFDEITVTIGIIIGLKPIQSFTGHAHEIKNDDKPKMEAESFFEAAQNAWDTKYGREGIEAETAEFVKKELENKWQALRGEELTSKILEFN